MNYEQEVRQRNNFKKIIYIPKIEVKLYMSFGDQIEMHFEVDIK